MDHSKIDFWIYVNFFYFREAEEKAEKERERLEKEAAEQLAKQEEEK